MIRMTNVPLCYHEGMDLDDDLPTTALKGPPTPSRRLVYALMHKGEAELRQAIADGAPLDRPVLGGETILNLAILRRSREARAMVKVLLELGADPLRIGDEANPNRGSDLRTAFHVAAICADTQTLKRLIQHSPEGVNVLDRKGRTPLMAGLIQPATPVNYKAGVPLWVLALIKAGADVNAAAPGMRPVFHHLLGKRRTIPAQPVAWDAWITTLLDAGLDPMAPDAMGVPATYAAIATGNFLSFVQRLWAAGGTMDRLTPEGRDGWSFVPTGEEVRYRRAWTEHETTLLQQAVQRGTDGSPLDMRIRPRL